MLFHMLELIRELAAFGDDVSEERGWEDRVIFSKWFVAATLCH